MKILKKGLSILLAVMMVFTCFSVGTTVLAADKIEQIEQTINKLPKSGTSMKDADKATYDSVCSQMAELTDDEKNKIDPYVIYRFLKVGMNVNTAKGEYDIDGFAKFKASVALPPYIDEAIALWKTLTVKGQGSNYYLDAYGTASYGAKVLAGCYNEKASESFWGMVLPGEAHFVTDPAGNTMITEKLFFDELVKAYEKETPFTGTAVASVAAPNPKSYAKVDGKYKNNEDYKAALTKWIEDVEPYRAYLNEKNQYSADMKIKALNAVAAANEVYANYAKFAEMTVEGFYEHMADESKLDKAEQAIKVYETLTDAEKKFVTNGVAKDFVYTAINLNEKSDTTAAKTADSKNSLNSVYTSVQGFALEPLAKEFDEYIASVNEPYTREIINEAKEKYAAMPTVVRGKLLPETVVKFAEIKAAITEDERVNDADLSGYTPLKTTDIAPGVKYKSAVNTSTNLVFLLKKVIPSDALKNELDKALTNENVGKATVMLHNLLIDKLGSSTVSMVTPFAATPKKFVEMYIANNSILNETDKFAGAIAKLGSADSWEDVATFENGDWGFEDGDVDGFVNGLLAALRDISMSLFDEALMGQHVITTTNKIDKENGEYGYGAYEELIPLLEILDLKGVISSDEYTRKIDSLNYRKLTDGDDLDARKMNMKIELAESYLRPVLEPIAGLVKELENDCFGTLVEYLPKIAYAVDSGLADDCVHNFLGYINSLIGMFAPEINDTLASFALDTGALYELIAPELRAISVNGTVVSFDVTREQWDKLIEQLSGCSEAVAKPTVKAGMKTRMGLDTDREKTMYVIVNFIYDFEKTENGKKSVSDLIDAIDMNGLLKGVVSFVLTGLTSLNRKTCFTLLSVFIPMANIIIVVVNFVKQIFSVFKK